VNLPFSIPLTIISYAAAWVILHFGCGYVAHALPERLFRPGKAFGRALQTRRWEDSGRFYRRLGIRRWKELLPEAGALYRGGFNKSRLISADRAHLERFLSETNRAELSHWLTFISGASFFLWNPWWVGLFMMGYAAATNLPFIAIQRYNRPRLAALEGWREA